MNRILPLLATFACAWLANSSALAFSLLGPYAPWMTTNIGYRLPDDIGGPMDLHEEYRWNLPTLTYGFDPSFLDYFGPDGVAAVEEAIQVLNDLPPASEIAITNAPTSVRRMNYRANAGGLVDLRSETLFLLLRQMGLAPAIRNVCTMRRWTDDPYTLFGTPSLFEYSLPDWFFGTYGLRRNFDPITLEPSRNVHGFSFFFSLLFVPERPWLDAYEGAPDLFDDAYIPVSEGFVGQMSYYPPFGSYYKGLSQDDVGGLAYLLNRTNVNVEELPGEILSATGNPDAPVRRAPRPGIEKVQFVRHPTLPDGSFARMTNAFADVFFTNALPATQAVFRVLSEPDIVFAARDLGATLYKSQYSCFLLIRPFSQSSDTSGWMNYAAANGQPGALGPGVITPPVRIAFHTPGKWMAAAAGGSDPTSWGGWNWGRFDGTTNVTVLPGPITNSPPLSLSLTFTNQTGQPFLEWVWLGKTGSPFQLLSSTNLSDWSLYLAGTNTSGIVRNFLPATRPNQFFRLLQLESP